MITCPKCNNSLPDWAQSCQFCGNDVKAVARPVQPVKKNYYAYGTAAWVWVVYYVLSSLMLLQGVVISILAIIGYMAQKAIHEQAMADLGVSNSGYDMGASLMGGSLFIVLFAEGLVSIVALGLLFKNDFLRTIGTWVLAIFVFFMGYNMLGFIGGSSNSGMVAGIIILGTLMLSAGMLIYCILETNDEC